MRRRDFIKLLGGAAAVWPIAARAQPTNRARRVGVLMAFNEADARARSWISLFDDELAKLGWSGNRKPQTDVRWAGDNVDRMRTFAKELVALQPDVILSFGTPVTAVSSVKHIPFRLYSPLSPIPSERALSQACPILAETSRAFTIPESSIGGKWMELLKQIAPSVTRAAMIFDPDTAPGHGKYYMPDFEASARSLNVQPIAAPVHSVAEREKVIADLGREPGSGFIAMADFFLFINRETAISLAARNRVPAVYPWRDVVVAGGLLCTAPISRILSAVQRRMSIASCTGKSRPIYLCRCQPNLRLRSISKPPRRLGWRCRLQSS